MSTLKKLQSLKIGSSRYSFLEGLINRKEYLTTKQIYWLEPHPKRRKN